MENITSIIIALISSATTLGAIFFKHWLDNRDTKSNSATVGEKMNLPYIERKKLNPLRVSSLVMAAGAVGYWILPFIHKQREAPWHILVIGLIISLVLCFLSSRSRK